MTFVCKKQTQIKNLLLAHLVDFEKKRDKDEILKKLEIKYEIRSYKTYLLHSVAVLCKMLATYHK